MNVPFIQAACYSKGRLAKVRWLVWHACQGSYSGTIGWFLNPSSRVSAHYVLGQNGQITQMVKEQDRAWATCNANSVCVSVEHEDKGQCRTNPNWITPVMWDKSVALFADMCVRYGLTVTAIIGHNDPLLRPYGNNHDCPSKFWNRDKFRADVQKAIDAMKPPAKLVNRSLGMFQAGMSQVFADQKDDT